MVPEYRLSKFQRVLPDRWQVEMVGAYLLDFEGAAQLLEIDGRASRPAR
jgi:ATP-dependent Lhr-like helicase